jgi:hypothetical protein
MNADSASEEQLDMTFSRMRPSFLPLRWTAAAMMVLPVAPRPRLPDFWPPMKNSSTSTMPESFSRSLRIVQRRSFLQPRPSGIVAA